MNENKLNVEGTIEQVSGGYRALLTLTFPDGEKLYKASTPFRRPGQARKQLSVMVKELDRFASETGELSNRTIHQGLVEV